MSIQMNNTNALSNCRLAFIGCGVMAEAIVAGLLRKQLVSADQIVGSHPRAARREELYTKYGIEMFEQNREATLDAMVGPTATALLGPVAISLQGGGSAVRLQQKVSYGLFTGIGIGTAF